jgi:hypothetical protein
VSLYCKNPDLILVGVLVSEWQLLPLSFLARSRHSSERRYSRDRTSSFLGRLHKLSVFGRLVHTLGMAGDCDGIVTVAGKHSGFESFSGLFSYTGKK